MSRRPKPCESACGRPVRQRRGARFCSPCVSKLAKKRCRVCGEDFHPDMVVGLRCRPCASKASHGKRVVEIYSITPEQYAAILEAQGGGCFICQRRPGLKRLAVDHDHSCCAGPTSCGRCVRGLLCRSCNRDVLGHLKDDPAALLRAVEYLANPPARVIIGQRIPKEG